MSELMTIPASERVEVTGIKLNLVCKNCGHKWGTYLLVDHTPQANWDICLQCLNHTLTEQGECKDEDKSPKAISG